MAYDWKSYISEVVRNTDSNVLMSIVKTTWFQVMELAIEARLPSYLTGGPLPMSIYQPPYDSLY